MFALLSHRCMRWLGHVHRLQDGRIPKGLPYGEFATGSRPACRPTLRYKDVCKRDVKESGIDPARWKSVADDRNRWRCAVPTGVELRENRREAQWVFPSPKNHY